MGKSFKIGVIGSGFHFAMPCAKSDVANNLIIIDHKKDMQKEKESSQFAQEVTKQHILNMHESEERAIKDAKSGISPRNRKRAAERARKKMVNKFVNNHFKKKK